VVADSRLFTPRRNDMKMQFLVATLLCLFSVGCIMPSYKSLNAQRSAIRGGGDIGVTVALDSVDTGTQAEDIALKTKDITIAVDKFLQDGKIADLTIPEITGELRKLIPADYQFIFDMLIAQISGITVPTEKIGVNNVKRLRSLCAGIILGCVEYKASDRVAPTAKDLKAPADNAAAVKAFGERFKIEVAKRKVR